MIVAILLVHISGGFFLPTGFEFALTLAGVSIAIALMGPGAYSIDAKQGRA
jgi:putative oxidoreductase